MKQTKHDLKRKFKKEILQLESRIKAKCLDCCNYGADGFEDCEIWDCPLHSYKITRGDRKAQKFQAVFDEMERMKNVRGKISRGHWDRFFANKNLAIKTTAKKINLAKKGGDQDSE